MKLYQQKTFWIISTMILTVGYIVSCTKTNHILDLPVQYNGTELFSEKTATPPTIDGTIDADWNKAQKLNFTVTVPDPGNGLFAGYQGMSYKVTLRSMYDNQNIYFLAEVGDPDKNLKASPWYFDPTTKLWAKESNSNTLDINGNLIRQGFGRDQFAMLWNIDNSTPKFVTQTCYASCHLFTPVWDTKVTPNVFKPNNSGNHYTNSQFEKIDMWWAHPERGMAFGNMDDEYQDYAGGLTYTLPAGGNGNGRHQDEQVPTGSYSSSFPYGPTYTSDPLQASLSNTQKLKLDGTGSLVDVPLWVIPNSTSDFIKAEDTLESGAARKIIAVSSTGILSYGDGSIDPNAGTDYQRLGTSPTSDIGPKCIPSQVISPVLRGRADISLSAVHTTNGWIYEYKRLLKTSDVLKQDIDFSSLDDQPFGVAVFNRSNNQHAIKPNLLLKFRK